MPLQDTCEMDKPARVLVVDDYEPWHRVVSSILETQAEVKVVGHAFDGLEGVQQAQMLRPELMLLDLGLPRLNGIQAARQIREVSPESRILIVTQTWCAELAELALEIGACGYVVKSEASYELFPAITAVLNGERFLSSSVGVVATSSRAQPRESQPR
jgi:DNA-binding NarL/FixJ family response regulator